MRSVGYLILPIYLFFFFLQGCSSYSKCLKKGISIGRKQLKSQQDILKLRYQLLCTKMKKKQPPSICSKTQPFSIKNIKGTIEGHNSKYKVSIVKENALRINRSGLKVLVQKLNTKFIRYSAYFSLRSKTETSYNLALRICNILNRKKIYKFYLDKDRDLVIEAYLPIKQRVCPDTIIWQLERMYWIIDLVMKIRAVYSILK